MSGKSCNYSDKIAVKEKRKGAIRKTYVINKCHEKRKKGAFNRGAARFWDLCQSKCNTKTKPLTIQANRSIIKAGTYFRVKK